MRILLSAVLAAMFSIDALAADDAVLTMHDGRFEPARLVLPTGVKLRLILRNQDAMPAEFESYDLSREVVVPGRRDVAIFVGPLEAGSYQFFNDFNRQMQGEIVAQPELKKGN